MSTDLPWFKTAIIYELHVRSFCDSDGDGIGDFAGLTEKLGYLEELGVTALWLLPFYPSPLRDDGYDIADYYAVNSNYGTLDQFKTFLAEAQKRGFRVITELVINHTSDQHPWFQRARRAAPGSLERDYYVWNDSPERFSEARIIFRDTETSNWAWDAEAQAYFWHRFYSHQPDLNFDNPAVREEVLKVVDFWLGLGVDGLRLDAVPYLFERDGTSCENLPETHDYLRQLRSHVDANFPGRMLLAEANQWPEDAVAYFGNDDECHMEFHFPLMPRLFMALQMEDRFPVIDILEQTPPIPDGCQWAIFLRNHDELTLEMVTDEERDYMYRIYARDAKARINLGIRRRLAPLLGNSRRQIELINSLLLSLPGTPIIYYGDEIGMGDNFYLGDRNGVRTPMQWSADRNAGFSRANPQQLFLPVIIDPEFHYETVNADMQQKSQSSLFWWMRRILGLRKESAALAVGRIEFLRSDNSKVLTFLRSTDTQTILVVANLSRFAQSVALDLSAFSRRRPVEMSGGVQFPEIGEAPYHLTLGAHGFYWLALHANDAETHESHKDRLLPGAAVWGFELRRVLERNFLRTYLPPRRWFGFKDKHLQSVRITAEFGPDCDNQSRILLVDVAFADGTQATQVLTLALVQGEEAEGLDTSVILGKFADGTVLCEGLALSRFRSRLLKLIATGQTWRSGQAWLAGRNGAALDETDISSKMLGAEQSNSAMVFDDHLMLKVLRRFEAGPHPEASVLQALAAVPDGPVPGYRGEIRCNAEGGEGVLGILTEFVPNEGDGWTYTLEAVDRYFERVRAAQPEPGGTLEPNEDLIGGNYPERARQLGQRTGQLHAALGSLPGSEFSPEAFSGLYQRSLHQSLRSLLRRTENELMSKVAALPDEQAGEARAWLETVPQMLKAYGILLRRRFQGTKIRVHGDLHLGQVLYTGKDFLFIDFEGEPRRPLGERLLKRSPLVDVAGMMRSFDYAVQTVLRKEKVENRQKLEPFADAWLDSITGSYLAGYLQGASASGLLPPDPEDMMALLQIFVLDKAVYEIGYELNYRPELLEIPLRAVRRVLETTSALPQGTA